jgi:Type I restriction-modification system methyltransferase subunit
MTAQQLKDLESRLWKAADDLRANSKLTATEYSFPVLGLIFLRHAYRRFADVKERIEETLPVHPKRGRRPLTKDDFQTAKAIYLPENARWTYLASLPEADDIGEAVDNAMRSIEKEYEVLAGVLPKNYTFFEKDLLQRLIRIFNSEELDRMPGDLFGRIYEYFLNEFAKSGAQEGGEFFTPPSLVNAIVHIIEPNHGVVLDPACGSAGMFVQTGHFIEEEGENPSARVTFFGQEKTETNTKLAKMNIAVHGLDANIVEGNSFYDDKHNLVGKCDFVMANPPFNVDGVDKNKDSVKNDPRLPFGLPKNDNANYLWIQYFYSYLNENGRAGFVMASSASDAGHSERDIREKLVNTGVVDVMVSIGPKFFYTRSLPCTLWFFDRAKERDPERKNKTLMLDLRDVYRKVSSNLHDFTPEQLRNIAAIVGLYRGNDSAYQRCIADYNREIAEGLTKASAIYNSLLKEASLSSESLTLKLEKEDITVESVKKIRRHLLHELKEIQEQGKALLQDELIRKDRARRDDVQKFLSQTERLIRAFNELAEYIHYFEKELHWLITRFPKPVYNDVAGLCKAVAQEDIAANDYSLTAGRYVGVAKHIDNEFNFEERMTEIKSELNELDEEASKLSASIQRAMEGLGL